MEGYYSAHKVENYFDLFTGMFCQPGAPSYSTFTVKDKTITVNSYTADKDGNAVVAEDVAEEIEEIELVAPKDDNWTMHDDIRHWVVAGSYSTMENAERAIVAIEEEFSEIHCKIFTLGKMFAVAIYGSSDLEECSKYKQEHRKEFEQCWIFTPKEYR